MAGGSIRKALPRIAIAVCLAVGVRQGTEVRDRLLEESAGAAREEQTVRDLNRVTVAYLGVPPSARPWDLVLIPVLARDPYNALFYANPSVGVLAFRLGHTRAHPMAAYEPGDFVVPFPYGRLGRLCLSREMGRVRTLSGSVDVVLHEGQVLLGARLREGDPRNLYRTAEGASADATPQAQRVPVRAGRLYMYGATFSAPADAPAEACLRLDGASVGLGDELLTSRTLVAGEQNRIVFGYAQPSRTGEILFEPQAEPPAPAGSPGSVLVPASASRVFFLDVTIGGEAGAADERTTP